MKKWNIILATLLVFFSCTNEVDDYSVKVDPDLEGKVTFRLQMPGLLKPTTYAATESDENLISELDVLALAKMNTIDTLAYRVSINSADIVDAATGTNGNIKEIMTTLARSNSDLKFVLIANAKTMLDQINPQSGDSFSTILDLLKVGFSQKWQTSPMVGIPMWGQTDGYITFQNPGSVPPIEITLLRSLAKVDVGIDLYGDPAIGFGSRFELEHVYVYNVTDSSFVVPDLTDAGLASNKVTHTHIPSGANLLSTPLEYVAANADSLFSEIYLPKAVNSGSTKTFLVVGGCYDGGSETFYRIDFVKNDQSSIDLLRNHRYVINITNIARDGFATHAEAANAKSSHIEYTLNTIDESFNSIVYNGQYSLAVSDSRLICDWEASSLNPLHIKTDYPGGFTIVTPTWINNMPYSGTQEDNITFYVDQYNEEHLFRTGTIRITAGTLVQDVEVRQYIGSNSVIVATSSTVDIPVRSANADGTQRITGGMTLTPEVLWQDGTGVVASVSVTGTGKDAIINVTSGTGAGNAVVAVKSGGTVLWSWHVWVTDYDPETTNKSYNGTTFMDRNLGAVSNTQNTQGTLGLLYQWGRKDPFPGASATNANTLASIYDGTGTPTAITYTAVTASPNYTNADQNPMTYYYSTSSPYYDWYGTNTAYNMLWCDAQGNKTPYDPCPHGWRVPVSTDAWNGVSSTWNAGGVLSYAGYLPAAGILSFSSGGLTEVGSSAYIWTAATSGVKAKALNITSSGGVDQSLLYRASGCSVRCVKE